MIQPAGPGGRGGEQVVEGSRGIGRVAVHDLRSSGDERGLGVPLASFQFVDCGGGREPASIDRISIVRRGRDRIHAHARLWMARRVSERGGK